MAEYHTDHFGQQREVSIKVQRHRSAASTWALRCAIPFFIPVLPLIGTLLGIVAIRAIRTDASKTGHRRAQVAAALGLAFTLGQALLLWQAWVYYGTAQQGPRPALVKGMSGDVGGFVAAFEPTTARLDPAKAAMFLETLQQRYGSCRDVNLIPPKGGYLAWRPFQPLHYRMRFTEQSLALTAQLVVLPDLMPWDWKPRLRYIEIHDDERGDLRFPADEAMTPATGLAGVFIRE